VTGVAAGVVRGLARDLAGAGRAAVYGRVGVSIQEFGGLANWLVEALNVVTGHFDEPGGMMFTTPAVDLVTLASMLGQRGSYNRFKSRVRGAPEFGGELPVACLAEEIETPGEGQIRALVTLAGNPVLSAPNGRRLDGALASLEFMVSIDPYLNETTRHAHLILPPTMALEKEHYDLALYAFAVRNTAHWSPTLFERAPDQRHDWEILSELAIGLSRRGDALDPLRVALTADRVSALLERLARGLRDGSVPRPGPVGIVVPLRQLPGVPHADLDAPLLSLHRDLELAARLPPLRARPGLEPQRDHGADAGQQHHPDHLRDRQRVLQPCLPVELRAATSRGRSRAAPATLRASPGRRHLVSISTASIPPARALAPRSGWPALKARRPGAASRRGRPRTPSSPSPARPS
jgi:hypothetical protein